MVGAVILASALGAAFIAWSGEPANDSAPIRPPGKVRPASIASQIIVGGLLVAMLQGAYERADDLSELNASNASLAAAEHRARLRPDHAASQLTLGEAYFQAGRYADARSPLEKVRMLTSGPDDFRTMHYADRTWQERVVPEKKTYARATLLYALTRAHLASSDVAIEYYRQAYELGGHSREVTEPLVDALMKEQEYDEVIGVIRRHWQDHGIDPDLDRKLAVAEAAQETIDIARGAKLPALSFPSTDMIARLEEAARRNPKDGWVEEKLTDAYLMAALGTQATQTPANFDVAAAHARRAALLEPRAAYYRAQLGLALTLAEHFQAADSAFAAALALDPSFLETHPAFQGARAFAHMRAIGQTPAQGLMFEIRPTPPP
jgi:tetratricopeptide (TPR) repeat protein